MCHKCTMYESQDANNMQSELRDARDRRVLMTHTTGAPPPPLLDLNKICEILEQISKRLEFL